MSDATELMRMRRICKSYGVGTPVETEVLHGVDLAIGKGEFVALIGPRARAKHIAQHHWPVGTHECRRVSVAGPLGLEFERR